jgi:hypothetical protein
MLHFLKRLLGNGNFSPKDKFEVMMSFPVTDIEGLQKRWNNPIVVKLVNKRVGFVSTMVVVEDKIPYWHGSIRISGKNEVKGTSLWVASDKYAALLELEKQFPEKGLKEQAEKFYSKFGFHIKIPFTIEETNIIKKLRGDLF